MERNNKKLTLITIIICILLLAGCKNVRIKTIDESEESGLLKTEKQDIEDSKIDDEADKVTKIPEPEAGNKEQVKKDNKQSADPAPTTIQPAENTELMIYTVNAEAELETVTALIPKDEEITPKLIVDTVIDSMADNSFEVKYISVDTEDDSVIVNFPKEQPVFGGVGGGFETAILDAIAQSLIDNLKEYKKVIYRMDNGPYVSGHIELLVDEVYLGE